MKFNKDLSLAVASAALSIFACFIYYKIYTKAFYVDFSMVMPAISIIAFCIVASALMTLGYVIFRKWKGEKNMGWLNLVYTAISFATIMVVLTVKLPLDLEFPELFPGLAIPMHFFPVLSFLAIVPFFKSKSLSNNLT